MVERFGVVNENKSLQDSVPVWLSRALQLHHSSAMAGFFLVDQRVKIVHTHAVSQRTLHRQTGYISIIKQLVRRVRM